ncbi:hypothetical protein [Actinomyces glycerinitolerans]|uniref:hypothetical protein n=1 Tax=Actinomyces glycerinitolerans TaxID=1892869 RepID=UPI001114978C|nr:hypothetical protein [Actinomyces glycerinitolerans]
MLASTCLVWLLLFFDTPGPPPKRTRPAIPSLLAASPAIAASFLFARLWWHESQRIQATYPVLAQLAVTAAGIGIAAGSDIGLRRAMSRAAKTAKTPTRTARSPRMTGAPTRAAAATLAAAAVALSVPSAVFVATSVQVTAAEPEPIPETLSDGVRWQRVIDHDYDDDIAGVIAGAVGPILITDHGAMGLDSSTGETTWSYSRPARLHEIAHDCSPSTQAHCDTVLSPDGTHLVIGYGHYPLEIVFVVLNTTNGEVVFEHTYKSKFDRDEDIDELWEYNHPVVQVTDHVLVVEQEVLSLTDGSLLDTMPDAQALRGDVPKCPADDSVGCRRRRPPASAGHSTLVLKTVCWGRDDYPDNDFNDVDYTWCEMGVAPDSDLTAVTTVRAVVPSDEADSDVGPVVGGWTVRYADPDAAYEELIRSNQSEDPDSLSFPLEAVSLDAMAGFTDAEPVALGDLNRPERNETAHTLTILGTPEPYKLTARTHFDPVTKQVYADADAPFVGPGYLDSLRPSESRTDDGTDLVGTDGTIAMHVNYPDPQPNLEYQTRFSPYLVQAPGAVVVVDTRQIHQRGNYDPTPIGYETVIYGVG